jgi:hypothetical protein
VAAALLLLGPTVAGAEGERRALPSPVVVDGAGRVVGTAAGAGELLFATVAIRVKDQLARVLVGRDRFVGSNGLVAC